MAKSPDELMMMLGQAAGAAKDAMMSMDASPRAPAALPDSAGLTPGISPAAAMVEDADAVKSETPMSEGLPPGVTASTLMRATEALVKLGLLPAATDVLTPAVLSALTSFAESDSPGMYDLSNPSDLAQVIHVAANR